MGKIKMHYYGCKVIFYNRLTTFLCKHDYLIGIFRPVCDNIIEGFEKAIENLRKNLENTENG